MYEVKGQTKRINNFGNLFYSYGVFSVTGEHLCSVPVRKKIRSFVWKRQYKVATVCGPSHTTTADGIVCIGYWVPEAVVQEVKDTK